MSGLQTTIERAGMFSGIALHSGLAVRVRLLPQPENSGIIFYRADLDATIKACNDNVGDTRLATTLGAGAATIGTVEHLLSALAALGIDNLRVEADGPELPILDGSAAPWMLFLTDACGVAKQQAARRMMRVTKKIMTTENGGRAAFMPTANGTARYTVRINFPHAVVRRTNSEYSHTLVAGEYEEEISRARTFCYVNEVDYMRRNHRALGGSLENAVVYDDSKVLNAGGLRYPDEFVRHKVLDAIGDCYINGNFILADYEADCPGHALNHALVSALLADKEAWEWN